MQPQPLRQGVTAHLLPFTVGIGATEPSIVVGVLVGSIMVMMVEDSIVSMIPSIVLLMVVVPSVVVGNSGSVVDCGNIEMLVLGNVAGSELVVEPIGLGLSCRRDRGHGR